MASLPRLSIVFSMSITYKSGVWRKVPPTGRGIVRVEHVATGRFYLKACACVRDEVVALFTGLKAGEHAHRLFKEMVKRDDEVLVTVLLVDEGAGLVEDLLTEILVHEKSRERGRLLLTGR